MKHRLAWLLSAVVVATAASLSATATAAEPAACLLENKFEFMGQKFDISDCIQNQGETRANLVKACDGIAKMATDMGIPAPKTTWLASCPPAPQGRCEHMNGTKLTAFYYKRKPAELPNVKSSCEMMGGRYVSK